MKAHGVMFHHFHNENHIVEQGSISDTQLAEIIKYYQQNYNLLNADEFYDRAINGRLKEDDTCITFDDALLCQYEVAEPVLKSMGLTAFWFVYTSPLMGTAERLEVYRHFRHLCFDTVEEFYGAFDDVLQKNAKKLGVDICEKLMNFNPKSYLMNSPFYSDADRRFRFIRDKVLGEDRYNYIMDSMLEAYDYDVNKWKDKLWMSKENLKDLADNGNIIGLHSHTHSTVLGTYSFEKQKMEYDQCKHILEGFLDEPIKTVSYPCNSYNEDTEIIMKQLGINMGFTANINDEHGALFVPREDHANILRAIET